MEDERFWAMVDKTETCWLWTGTKYGRNRNYGQVMRGTRKIGAHRYAYELEIGPIPEGMVIDHLCGNPPCVNPAHLEAVTNRENLLRGDTQAARNAVKTHCPHGHEYTPENTGVNGPNKRRCKACARAWYHANK